jgi:predicted metalloprotease with PDZ domain
LNKKHYIFYALQLLTIASFSQKYEVKIDLQKISGDKVTVTVKLPLCKSDTAIWCMPAIIPGTYAEYDFGRFISNFKAFSKKGKRLKVRKKNSNEFVIYHSKELAEISYKVNDTWDSNPTKNYVFQPAGTNIDKNKNVVLNHHGFVGYLLGMQNYEYEIEIKKNANFYANTALKVTHINAETDVEYAKSYVHLCSCC